MNAPSNSVRPWSAADSTRLYAISEWGQGYFQVSDDGRMLVRPNKKGEGSIDLYDVVQGLAERGVRTPVLIRLGDVLSHRLHELRGAFDAAVAESDYKGGYSCVYPIKVNQQRHVCVDVRDLAAKLGFGLEAGSKPELLAVLDLTHGHDSMPIICNGFKDEEFIETVVLAAKLGRNITPVVEKFGELESLIRQAKKHGIRPRIGIRVKLASKGVGRWEHSAGTTSKFGLMVSEVLKAVELLREHNMLDCLQLLHCHIGSQVPNIRHIMSAVTEVTHVYTELKRLGAAMGVLDIGGGLGVDYDGSRSTKESSVNYTLAEYASNVIWRVKSSCDEAGVEHPLVITESGRAMVAYESVLVFDVVGKNSFESVADMDAIMKTIEAEEEVPRPVYELLDAYKHLSTRNIAEVLHDATQARDESMELFSLGYMTLPLRAVTERLFWCIARGLLDRARGDDARHIRGIPELADLPALLSDHYFCNFSLFQSMPDSWAINQLFPICPIHRLNEEPTRRGVLSDITCDSDGRVDHFVCLDGEKHELELHDLLPLEGGVGHEPYYLGVFLLGAYQEILGDLHNLLGDTHAVHIRLGDNGRWEIEEVVEGDAVKEVLGYVEFDHVHMRRAMRKNVELSVKDGRLTVAEGQNLMNFYERALDGYTYLED